MNNAMQECCTTDFKTSEQHKEVGKSRLVRDEKDATSLYAFLQERNPFGDSDTSLRNIETGVTADCKVNVDDAKKIGNSILNDMTNSSINRVLIQTVATSNYS